jgi:signal transduction histidine kinase
MKGNSSRELLRAPSVIIRPLLNALPGNVALIDSAGQVVAANSSWLALAKARGILEASRNNRLNYSLFCESLISEFDVARAVQGLREILSGKRDRFELEHPDHGSEGEHWFRLTITRIEEGTDVCAIVTHDSIDDFIDAQDALKFETLLSEMSAAFVRADANQIDAEIEHWLRRIVLGLRIDRSTVAQFSAEERAFYITHQWSRQGVPRSIPLGTNATETYPWLAKKVMSGEVVILANVEDFASEAPRDFEFAMGAKSNVTVPLRVGGQIVGAVAFGSVFRRRKWSPRIVERLTLAAEVFGNAIERMRTDADLRRLEHQLSRMSRVVTMGELTASLAHELNQPLGAILNNAQAARRFLKAKKPDIKEVQTALDEIIRDDRRAVETVANVRALFKPGEAKRSPLDLKQTMLDVEKVLRADAMTKGISLKLKLPNHLPIILADKTALIQAVINLVINAFDSITEAVDGSREVEVDVTQPDPACVRVGIKDTGKGIDPSIADRLFQPFVTTKAEGLGMGLVIVRSIINRHGGDLRVFSNQSRGATFEFTLPVQNTEASY